MGRSIVYCDICGKLLREEDFASGKASTVDNRYACSDCRPITSPPLPKSNTERIGLIRPLTPKSMPRISTTQIPIPRPPSGESRRALPAVPPPAPPPPSKTPLVVGISVGVAVLLILIAAVTGSKTDANRAPSVVIIDPPRSPPPPPPLVPVLRGAGEDAARKALDRALDLKRSNPNGVAERWKAAQDAVAAAKGTGFEEGAAREFASLQRRVRDEVSEVDGQARGLLVEDKQKASLEVWEAALRRYDLPEWRGPAEQGLADFRKLIDGKFAVLRDAAVEARKAQKADEVARLRGLLEKWGLPDYVQTFDLAVAAAVAVKPADPPPPPPPGELVAIEEYRAKWKQALAGAASREPADAIRGVEQAAAVSKAPEVKKEAAADVELLKLAAAATQEALAMLPRLPKGQKAALKFMGSGGTVARVEDVVLKIDAYRVELKQGDGSVTVAFGEVQGSTLADLFASRPAKKPETDARAAAVLCLMEGDEEAAKRFLPGPTPEVPEKWWSLAREPRGEADKERAARQTFHEAERSYYNPAEALDAVGKYKALIAEHGATAFVKRNRAAISARIDGGKDFMFLHADLTVAPLFKASQHAKAGPIWTSAGDVEESRIKENWVELAFSAAPDAEYRCWILAGGCCQEVFTCFLQATDLTAVDPQTKEKVAVEIGSGTMMPVKLPFLSLKKLHAQHSGPKEPDRFEWITIPLPKFATPGAKRVRILAPSKGFSVAWAAVSSTRKGEPRESDAKAEEKFRAETPGYSRAAGGIATGFIYREIFRGIGGGGMNDLKNSAAFKEDRPTEGGVISNLLSVNMGDDYGTRIRGFVHPPETGTYVFWLCSDDDGELYLGTSEDPSTKRRICSLSGSAGQGEYGRFPSQKSEPITLQGGRRYYLEALHKEGGGSDHVMVGWTLPGGAEEKPIPGTRVSPFIPPKK